MLQIQRKSLITMKKNLSVVGTVVAFLFAFAVSFHALISDAWALGDFSQTCRNVSISGSTLSASCEKANGGYQDTKIDLNSNIGNVDGSLSWSDQNFIKTCRNTSVSGSTLQGECKKRDQSWTNASINLDTHIANINGSLQYE